MNGTEPTLTELLGGNVIPKLISEKLDVNGTINSTTLKTKNIDGSISSENVVYGSWTQLGQDIDGEAAGDYSGYSVSLSSDGTIVAIGAYLNDDNGTDSGHVRVYQYSGGSWTQLGQDIDGEAAGDYSGISVSLSSDGTIVAIGAYLNDDNGIYSGHVRVYQYSGGSWTQLGQDIDGEANNDYSGNSVSLSSDGTIVAIGAYLNDDNGNESGHVRVYKIDVNPSLYINSYVGIGTDNPTEALDVNGNIQATGSISGYTITGELTTASQTNITSLGTLTSLSVDNLRIDGNTLSSVNNEDIIISPNGTGKTSFNGNVGIGTDNPSYNLDLYDGNFRLLHRNDGTVSNNFLTFERSQADDCRINHYSDNQVSAQIEFDGFSTNPQTSIKFHTKETNGSLTDRMIIHYNGNVGIGTSTNLSHKLNVNGTTNITGNLSFGSSKRQMINLYNDEYGIGVQSSTTYFRSFHDFQFYKGGSHNDDRGNAGGGTALLTIKEDGNVGIGTDPNYKLHVNGNAYISGSLVVTSRTTSPTITYRYYAYNGYGGINTAPVAYSVYSPSGRHIAEEFNATSDRRCKGNIHDIKDETVERFMRLKAKTYHMKKDELKETRIGFIAQDVLYESLNEETKELDHLFSIINFHDEEDMMESIDSETGVNNPKGKCMNLNYNSCVPLLQRALQIEIEKNKLLEERLSKIETILKK
jgi:hypothetical protein